MHGSFTTEHTDGAEDTEVDSFMSNLTIAERIRAIVQRKPLRMQSLTGGKISQVMRVDFEHGDSLVVKTGVQGPDLTIEAYMLNTLRERSELPVPRVLHAETDLLLMEHIAGTDDLRPASLRHLGQLLARCHEARGSAYGLERDTLIGPLHQPNPPMQSWVEFFRAQRLLYMTDLARESGELPRALESRLLKFADVLDDYLIEPDCPALIHGDIWRTNIIVNGGRVAGIIDPALYYAHNEMELAYMTLFDGFGGEVFDAYHEIKPIDRGFRDVRRHIYNLYPLLTHLIIFGAKYIKPLDESLTRFGH